MVTNTMSPTFEFLEVSVIFYKRGQSLLNLLLRLMKVSYLVMIQTLVHTMFSMSPLIVLKSRVMRHLMRLMTQNEQVDLDIIDDEEAPCDTL
jgi:hypothetical protein